MGSKKNIYIYLTTVNSLICAKSLMSVWRQKLAKEWRPSKVQDAVSTFISTLYYGKCKYSQKYEKELCHLCDVQIQEMEREYVYYS